eukprot:3522071-Prymnesium_polylepis.2
MRIGGSRDAAHGRRRTFWRRKATGSTNCRRARGGSQRGALVCPGRERERTHTRAQPLRSGRPRGVKSVSLVGFRPSARGHTQTTKTQTTPRSARPAPLSPSLR